MEAFIFISAAALVVWIASLQAQVNKEHERGNVIRHRTRFLESRLLTKEQLNESRADNVAGEWY